LIEEVSWILEPSPQCVYQSKWRNAEDAIKLQRHLAELIDVSIIKEKLIHEKVYKLRLIKNYFGFNINLWNNYLLTVDKIIKIKGLKQIGIAWENEIIY
jgi:hypothetical protein